MRRGLGPFPGDPGVGSPPEEPFACRAARALAQDSGHHQPVLENFTAKVKAVKAELPPLKVAHLGAVLSAEEFVAMERQYTETKLLFGPFGEEALLELADHSRQSDDGNESTARWR